MKCMANPLTLGRIHLPMLINTHTHTHTHTCTHGKLNTCTLTRTTLSLSLSHRSRPGIYVHYLVPGSKGEECGNIKPGDRILEVNGKDLRDSTVDEAAAFMMVKYIKHILHIT